MPIQSLATTEVVIRGVQLIQVRGYHWGRICQSQSRFRVREHEVEDDFREMEVIRRMDHQVVEELILPGQ